MMEYALVTWWTSGIGKEVVRHLISKDIFSLVTWSGDTYSTGENELYLKNDQRYDFEIGKKIKEITDRLDYVFLNVGIFVPDEADEEDLQLMHTVNYKNTINLLLDLDKEHLLDHARIIVNASMQAKHPRALTKKYAETKQRLCDDSLAYAKQKNLNLSVIWPSAVKDTPMLEKLIQYYISKDIYTDKDDFLEKVPTTDMSDVTEIIDKIFFGDENIYNERFLHTFIPIDTK